MKNIYKILTLGVIFIALSACGNNWLDLDPATAKPSDKAITDYKSAEEALTGIYSRIQGNSGSVSYYGANLWVYGDVRGEDMQSTNLSSRGATFYAMKYLENNAPAIWGTPYTIIRNTNNLLEALESGKIADATDTQINELKSEALAIRALVHFDLCRIYGMPYTANNGTSLGVPIVLTSLPVEALETRNTVAEVYTQVLLDLGASINTGGLSKEKTYGYINYWFVKGLLSKVNLYKGDNEAAFKHAEDIIKDSPYGLWTNEEYVEGWKTTSSGRKEMLFEIVNYSRDNWTDREGIANLMNPKGYGDVIATKAFIDMLATTPDDVRHGLFLEKEEDNPNVILENYKVFVNKYPVNEAGEWRLNSLPVMRLSEIYLFAAEAAAKLKDSSNAAKYLNVIHKRANPNAADISETDATLERIILERRKELIGEGSRFFDAMRNNETITRYTSEEDRGFHPSLDADSRTFNRDYFRAILPIPISEINANAPIREQQNPGY